MDQVYGRGACESTEYAFYRRVTRQTLYEICALEETARISLFTINFSSLSLRIARRSFPAPP